MYADFNKVQLVSYFVQSVLTGVSAFYDSGHPVSFVSNIITVIFGVLVFGLIRSSQNAEYVNEDEETELELEEDTVIVAQL